MDPAIYKHILNYKTNGSSYPDGYSKNEKANLKKKANTFDLQGKSRIKYIYNFYNYVISSLLKNGCEI